MPLKVKPDKLVTPTKPPIPHLDEGILAQNKDQSPRGELAREGSEGVDRVRGARAIQLEVVYFEQRLPRDRGFDPFEPVKVGVTERYEKLVLLIETDGPPPETSAYLVCRS